MLTFVGLGLYDEHSVTVAGQEALRAADHVFAEFYTSKLVGTSVDALESHHGVDIEVRGRDGIEGNPEPILDAAESGDAVFLTAGDTMISTTHVDLRMRAHDRGIETHVVHGTTAQTAASSLTGLQNYRFGKATTLPFERAHGGDGVPDSVVATLRDNRNRDLHTLVYLDIKAADDDYMTADTAAGMLAEAFPDTLAVAVCQAGSSDPTVRAETLSALSAESFGPPLHLLVVPGHLHLLEREALVELADAPTDCLD